MGRADIDMFTSYPVQSLTLESIPLFPVNADNQFIVKALSMLCIKSQILDVYNHKMNRMDS